MSYKYEIEHYQIIDSENKLKQLVEKMQNIKEFAFDTETNTLFVNGPNDNLKVVGISISWGKYDNFYIPMGHRRYEDVKRNVPQKIVTKYLKQIFEREDLDLVGHNIKFDMHVLKRLDIEIKTKNLYDTSILGWLIDENVAKSLKEYSSYYLKIKQTKFKEVINDVPKEVKKEFGLKGNNIATFDLVLIDEGAPYALDDAYYTFELYRKFLVDVEDENMHKIYDKMYKPIIKTVFDMEEKGTTVDLDELEIAEVEIKKDIKLLEEKLIEISGVEMNFNSNQQLTELLYGVQKEIPNVYETEAYKKASEKQKEKLSKKYKDNIQAQKDSIILKNSFKFKPEFFTKSDMPSTGADAILIISRKQFKTERKQQGVEFCKVLQKYKKLKKLDDAFISGMTDKLYSDNKIHTSFNITGTDSGRFSSSNPNQQQLPRAEEEDKYQIRKFFVGSNYVCDKDLNYICEIEDISKDIQKKINNKEYQIKRKKIIAMDYSNLEMRVLAIMSEDKNLIEMFRSGSDTHSSTAINMFNLKCEVEDVKKKYPHLRQSAKIINFLLMYGGSAPTLYDGLRYDAYSPIDIGAKEYLEQYNCKNGVEVAQVFIDKYFKSYYGVANFIQKQKRIAHKQEFVNSIIGRKRRLYDINSRDYKKSSYNERLSVNFTIQSSAGDITINAQNRIAKDEWFNLVGAYMLLQVHDEVVMECPEKYIDDCIEKMRRYMMYPFGDNKSFIIDLNTSADYGDNYAEAK